jgi:hypothetical protein
MSIHWGGRGAGHVSRWSLAPTGAPTLALNFLSGALDPLITFTRSGNTATRTNSSGAIELVNANLPRFDYDPVTLALKGLLIEEQRINLLLNSLIDGTPLSTQSVTVAATAHTISFYGTGTITLTGASVATVTGTGVYPSRRTLTFTPIVGVLVCTVTGSVQYAQLEAGGFVTSFIPTAGSSVTRSRDEARIVAPNFAPWYNASAGTLLIEALLSPAVDSGSGNYYVAISDGTSSNAINIVDINGTLFNVVTGGVTQFSQTVGAEPTGILKAALAYASNNTVSSANGAIGATDTSVALPTVTSLLIGIRGDASGSTSLNGHIRAITYYNTRLRNSQLQTLTQ